MNLIYTDTSDIGIEDNSAFLFDECGKLIWEFYKYDGEFCNKDLLETLGHKVTELDLSEVMTKKQISKIEDDYDASGIPVIVEKYLKKKTR